MSSLDIAHFKEVLGHYATGLVVVTAATADGPAGFTCQTFGSLSLQPPLVTFAAGSSGHSWGLVRQSELVGISILSADQEPLARRFATTGLDKFDGTAWEKGPDGSPLLDGALAHIEGRISGVTTHGDHDVAVVEVTYVHARSGHPLIYFRGGFSELA
ncbi:MAG TPA: flavin reductase family protein [Acidimicrobiales bacterium]